MTLALVLDVARLDTATSRGITGTATKYNELTTDRGGFKICFSPGAFSEFLSSPQDVYLLAQHDDASVMARTRNGSLRFWDTPTGVDFTAALPDTQLGRDTYLQVRSGLLSEVSIFFTLDQPDDVEWLTLKDGTNVLDINRAGFKEASIVTWAAFPSTSVRALRAPENLAPRATAKPAARSIVRPGGKSVQENCRDLLELLNASPRNL